MYHRRNLAKILLDYREKNRLSLRELEEKVDLSFSYLGKIERNDLIPPKETVIQIAEKLEMPAYQLVLSSGYIVNLDTDVKTVDLQWTVEELRSNIMMRYRIYTLPNLREILSLRGIAENKLAADASINYDTFREYLYGEHVILDDVVNICACLGVNFYEIFRVVKVNYDVKFKGARDDEDVAYQIHKYIKNTIKKDVAELKLNSNEQLNNEILVLAKEITSMDEIKYLRESLYLYRKLNLFSRGEGDV